MAKAKCVTCSPTGSQSTKKSINQPFQRAKNKSIRKKLRTVGILGRRMRTDDIIKIGMPPVILGYNFS